VPQLTIQQAYDFAIAAGFNHETAITLVGIGFAESSLETQGPDNINPANAGYPESRDRGWLQINDFWHKEVTDDCAYDPECAAKAAYVISNHGSSFWPWRTFQLGMHGAYLTEIRAVVDPTPVGGLTVSIEVPQTWVTDVSTKLGIVDPFAAPEPTGAKTYIIESGDTLSGIAQKLHGDSNAWPELYALNKVTIGDNPDLIEVGATLTLPEGW
jgi:Lysozyme like domain/LysM domain